ncbi:hypothetical protein MHAE_12363 [Mycobacterium haemophilum DSM 44634]|uniref:hypothetical protein n=1 Tax=Mycobacterium haemophilum TaxID=29311 RepID=UPI000A5A1889|nr:hypothetical protein [Mycobacterium haemophilum]MCV7342540.1 hypothetical protein [Mycobacterium haemophilum DSM 44634]
MIFVVAQRVTGATTVAGWSILRAGRLRTKSRGVRRLPTPQERTDRYLARMPISVIAG